MKGHPILVGLGVNIVASLLLALYAKGKADAEGIDGAAAAEQLGTSPVRWLPLAAGIAAGLMYR